MTSEVDICIIGGGIQGVGVAQAAAAAGYRVALLEKTALGNATSSASSKLIHGGLRYLETFQLKLVAESIRERDRLIELAPELVKRVPFYIPVYRFTSRRPWQVVTGLSIYALLGKLRATACFQKITPDKWSTLDQIRTRDLQAVYQYFDAQTDDVKLTRAVMQSATELGAQLYCPATFKSARYENNRYNVVYDEAGREAELAARCLVNATGPWVSTLQPTITPVVTPPAVHLVQGAHIVLKHPAPRGIYYVESLQDHRAVFIMPWYGKTMVGTTETAFSGDPQHIAPTQHEVEYLLAIARYYFPHASQEIDSQFAGARVLPVGDNKLFHRPRDTIYFQDERLPGYLALMGGKLTGYRTSALKAIRYLANHLPERQSIADTASLTLQPVDA